VVTEQKYNFSFRTPHIPFLTIQIITTPNQHINYPQKRGEKPTKASTSSPSPYSLSSHHPNEKKPN
jgi:hypothetical protein